MEHTTSQTVPPFTRVDLNQQAATVHLVIHSGTIIESGQSRHWLRR
jgi:hypothetical protein